MCVSRSTGCPRAPTGKRAHRAIEGFEARQLPDRLWEDYNMREYTLELGQLVRLGTYRSSDCTGHSVLRAPADSRLWPAILRAHAERESHQYELGQLVRLGLKIDRTCDLVPS
jgi:hypothetical protein